MYDHKLEPWNVFLCHKILNVPSDPPALTLSLAAVAQRHRLGRSPTSSITVSCCRSVSSLLSVRSYSSLSRLVFVHLLHLTRSIEGREAKPRLWTRRLNWLELTWNVISAKNWNRWSFPGKMRFEICVLIKSTPCQQTLCDVRHKDVQDCTSCQKLGTSWQTSPSLRGWRSMERLIWRLWRTPRASSLCVATF